MVTEVIGRDELFPEEAQQAKDRPQGRTQILGSCTEEGLLQETVNKELERYKKNQEIIEFWKPNA